MNVCLLHVYMSACTSWCWATQICDQSPNKTPRKTQNLSFRLNALQIISVGVDCTSNLYLVSENVNTFWYTIQILLLPWTYKSKVPQVSVKSSHLTWIFVTEANSAPFVCLLSLRLLASVPWSDFLLCCPAYLLLLGPGFFFFLILVNGGLHETRAERSLSKR